MIRDGLSEHMNAMDIVDEQPHTIYTIHHVTHIPHKSVYDITMTR